MTVKYLEFHPDAVADAEAQRLWYEKRSQTAAMGFAAELEEAFNAIAEDPDRWPVYLGGTRRYLLRRYPFLVVYRQIGDVIQVIAIAHGRRKPGYWISRT
jgi:plasmid stabilization system protein ParE